MKFVIIELAVLIGITSLLLLRVIEIHKILLKWWSNYRHVNDESLLSNQADLLSEEELQRQQKR